MQNNQKVSVVIPTHFRAHSLKNALNSVLEQTHPCAEIIVVSDGFDKKTDQLMRDLMQEHTVLKYKVVDPPQGGNHARNTGIRWASSEFIAFLDDDDEWSSEKVERQLSVINKDASIGLVCTACEVVGSNRQVIRTIVPNANYDSSTQILWENCIGTTSSVLIRRSLLEQSGLFDEVLQALQDYELWIRLCQLTRVGVVKEPSLRYFDAIDSIQISRNTLKYVESYESIFEKHNELIVSKLGSHGFKRRVDHSLLAIAKRAILNREFSLARENAIKAVKRGNLLQGTILFMLTCLPSSVASKTFSLIRHRSKTKIKDDI